MKRLGLLALSLALLLPNTIGCSRPDGSGGSGGDSGTGPIKVGMYGSSTGAQAAYGKSSLQGIQIAVDEINASGGVLGRKIELISGDTQSKAEDAATVVTKLVQQDRVVAVLGEVASSNSLAAAPICQRASIPMISPASTNEKVTQVGDYIFRVCFIDPFQGQVMAKFAAGDRIKAKRVAILTDTKSDYSVGLTRTFTEAFTKAGGQIAGEPLNYSQGDQDFRAQLTQIKSRNVDALFVPGYYNDVGVIIKQARDLGITVPVLGGDGWDSDPLWKYGEVLNNCFYSTHYSPENAPEKTQKFIDAYKSRYNETPDANAALAYDAALVLFDAIKRANSTDGKKIRDAIAATKDFPGVTGNLTIDANRNAVKSAVVLECKYDGTTVNRVLAARIEP